MKSTYIFCWLSASVMFQSFKSDSYTSVLLHFYFHVELSSFSVYSTATPDSNSLFLLGSFKLRVLWVIPVYAFFSTPESRIKLRVFTFLDYNSQILFRCSSFLCLDFSVLLLHSDLVSWHWLPTTTSIPLFTFFKSESRLLLRSLFFPFQVPTPNLRFNFATPTPYSASDVSVFPPLTFNCNFL